MINDIPEVECQNCGWQGDGLELIKEEGKTDKPYHCPECGSPNIEDYEDEEGESR